MQPRTSADGLNQPGEHRQFLCANGPDLEVVAVPIDGLEPKSEAARSSSANPAPATAGGRRSADDHRGDEEDDLVHQPGVDERAVHLGTALDQQGGQSASAEHAHEAVAARPARGRRQATSSSRTPASSKPGAVCGARPVGVDDQGHLGIAGDHRRVGPECEAASRGRSSASFAGGIEPEPSGEAGSSARIVPTPTRMASCSSRSSRPRLRAASPVIHLDSPVRVAMRPSRRYRGLEGDPRRPFLDPSQPPPVELAGAVGVCADVDLDPASAREPFDAACGIGVGVAHGDHDPPQAGRDDRVHAGWRLPVMGAGLEGDEQRAAAGAVAGRCRGPPPRRGGRRRAA